MNQRTPCTPTPTHCCNHTKEKYEKTLTTETQLKIFSIECVFFFFQVILGVTLSLRNAFEMQFDCRRPLFLHHCHHVLLVLKLILVPGGLRELT